MLTRTDVDGYAGTCAALRDADLTESTRALQVPTLLIVGDQDVSTPPDLVRSTAALPKELLLPVAALLRKVTLEAPVQEHQVVVSNVLDTGVDIIASRDLLTHEGEEQCTFS